MMGVSCCPAYVIWDVTYACPLRCVHCYSESGRRESRRLGLDGMLRVADALAELKPEGVALAGGEPLAVRGIVRVAERLSRAGVPVTLYTGGWSLRPAMARELARVCAQVTVSLDGATAAVHDRVRGRAGSFQRAMNALGVLDATVDGAGRAGPGGPRAGGEFRFGIDCTLVRSNFGQMEELCTAIAPRFPRMDFLAFGAAVPSGLASRPGFAVHELLTDDQAGRLSDPDLMSRLRDLAPASVRVTMTDNRVLQMHPEWVAAGKVLSAMQIEPDGAVRAMPMYEGTVGNVLTEPVTVLWERAVARWDDPFVTAELSGVRTMAEWARATRRIDGRFGSPETRERIARRPDLAAPVAGGSPPRRPRPPVHLVPGEAS
ncbi:radical SAM protein [Sphaerisporangium dianthi]|uniref:Radical SAM protein n=1 Tax=Sphaerisporangium dianthi TaxID=1436120 RepID=A0ABV9CUG1_9ACTN